MDAELIMPSIAEAAIVIKILTSWGFIVLAGTVVSMVLTQLLKVALANTKKMLDEEKAGDLKKALSLFIMILVTIPVGYVSGYDIIDNSQQYLGIFTAMVTLSSILYRFAVRTIFDKLEFTPEIIREKNLAKEIA